jgi:hypothetical protein
MVTGNGKDYAPAARRRLRGFGIHLAAYFVTMAVLIAINLLVTPNTIWFVLPLVGWGGVLAIHVAYVMGLFGRSGRD